MSIFRLFQRGCAFSPILLILATAGCAVEDNDIIPQPILLAQEDWGPLYRNLALNLHQTGTVPNIINVGGPPSFTRLGCDVEPELPAGLSIVNTGVTCTLGGMATEESALQNYTVTAYNVAGTDTVDLRFAVEISVPLFITFDLNAPVIYADSLGLTGTRAQIGILNLTAEALDSCVLSPTSPALPSGIGIEVSTVTDADGNQSNGSGCLIFGAPDLGTMTSTRTYTIRAGNTVGSTDLQLAIEFSVLPPILTLVSTLNPMVGEDYEFVFVNQGSPIDTCTLNIPLPEGLSLDIDPESRSCRISGTPTQPFAPAQFTLSASNPANREASVDLIFTLTIT